MWEIVNLSNGWIAKSMEVVEASILYKCKLEQSDLNIDSSIMLLLVFNNIQLEISSIQFFVWPK